MNKITTNSLKNSIGNIASDNIFTNEEKTRLIDALKIYHEDKQYQMKKLLTDEKSYNNRGDSITDKLEHILELKEDSGNYKLRVDRMKIRNNKRRRDKYCSDNMIDEVIKTISYGVEEKNGIMIHILNGKVFSFSKTYEFEFSDMKVNDKCTLDNIKNIDKYKKFAINSGLELLSVDKIYSILGEVAVAMGISDTINYDFFKDGSEKSKSVLQMFSNITGFEGRIPLYITNHGDVDILCCVCCNTGNFWFYDSIRNAYSNISLFLGL